MTQYMYLGDKLTDKRLKGESCQAVRRKSGKCVRGRSKMLVSFSGEKCIVLARRLRKVDGRYAVDCASTIPVTWPTKKYFKKLSKETEGMNSLEFFRYLNKEGI